MTRNPAVRALAAPRCRWLCVALAVASGCAAPDQEGAVGQARLSAVHVPERLPAAADARGPWALSCATPLPPDVLACVDGVAIDRAAFDRARAAAPADIDNRALVEALVEAEVLAAAALRRGLYGDWLLEAFRMAMVRRLLTKRFVADFGPEKVRQADLDRAWRRSPIRVRYNHETHYQTVDAQFLCCTGDWRGCEVDPKVQRCHADMYPRAEALAAELAADPPATDDEFEARVQAAAPRFAGVSVQRVGFYYDVQKPYDQQGEYDKMLEPWTLAVVAMRPGQISPPVRTPYGWHVIRLGAVTPRIEGKPTDPAVRDDLARGILDGVRERDLQLYLVERMRARNVSLDYSALGGD